MSQKSEPLDSTDNVLKHDLENTITIPNSCDVSITNGELSFIRHVVT